VSRKSLEKNYGGNNKKVITYIKKREEQISRVYAFQNLIDVHDLTV
jgi:hypothetical protein